MYGVILSIGNAGMDILRSLEEMSGSRLGAVICWGAIVAVIWLGGGAYRKSKIYKKIMKDKAKKKGVRGLDPLEDPISHAAFEEENPPTPTEALPLSQTDQAWRGPGQDPPENQTTI